MKVTLQEVAALAGCSLATASRALTGSGPVSQAMDNRVRRAALDLGYHRRTEGAVTGARPIIGVLIPSLSNPVFATSLSSLQLRCRGAGRGVIIAQSNYAPEQERSAIASLMAERPLGLVLTLCDPATCRALQADLPPTVLMNHPAMAQYPAAVMVDNHAAGLTLTKYLLAHGHRRILFITGEFTASDRARLRYAGYTQAMRAAGLSPPDAIQISFTDNHERLDLAPALATHSPTAIIASNDLLALGAIAALRREGRRVPQDISVAGFDGMSMGQMLSPRLTTMEMPDKAMGEAAAELLLTMIAANAAPRQIELHAVLRQGETVQSV
ncbi:transcriptional regulator protein, LacI family [Ketogulonicigenium robustum]|uniref:Transcriptional regulator protein, LacI family n=1 Tax=Ketogulonicigenium robustum TaxID=92947 RepID=A0A1W6NX71_9RHOB|nr:substrate-binding domain-containing protein [Ketogulonicigenium robustum]ARO13824.1 transcriptional regulator protein, LacI family [Ketogulonicigenium robustum]